MTFYTQWHLELLADFTIFTINKHFIVDTMALSIYGKQSNIVSGA